MVGCLLLEKLGVNKIYDLIWHRLDEQGTLDKCENMSMHKIIQRA